MILSFQMEEDSSLYHVQQLVANKLSAVFSHLSPNTSSIVTFVISKFPRARNNQWLSNGSNSFPKVRFTLPPFSSSSSSTKPKTSTSTTLQSFLSNRRVSFLFPSIMDSSPENPNPLPLYKTLPLTLLSPPPSPNQSPADPHPPYTVFRSDLSLCAAADFFSLDVGVDAEPKTPKTPPPTKKFRLEAPETSLGSGWFRGNSRVRSPMLQLHKEIVDFCDFLSPTQEEESSRNTAVQSVFEVIRYIWPNCWVEVFGSFKTGLYLPTSDIDVVILQSGITKPQMGLYALSRALSQKGIAKNIQVIAKARVPIIKFVEKISGFSFDISFDATNGPKAANFIKDAISKWPPLRPLCLILKVFLQQRKLNEAYSGGVGSYALLVMLIAMQQNLKEHEASLERNLGILLIHFFDFYGRKLNTTDVGVSCRGTGTFFLKRKKGFINKARRFLIAIEDPQAPENDIGKNSFNYFQIRSAFAMAFSTLTNPNTILGLDPNRSILGTIIRRDPVLLERKGGRNGEMTFTSLLPGAVEPLLTPNENDLGMLCSWGSGICEDSSGSSSGKKRKGFPKEKSGKKKVKSGQVRKLKQDESESRKEKAVKRRHRRGQQLSY